MPIINYNGVPGSAITPAPSTGFQVLPGNTATSRILRYTQGVTPAQWVFYQDPFGRVYPTRGEDTEIEFENPGTYEIVQYALSEDGSCRRYAQDIAVEAETLPTSWSRTRVGSPGASPLAEWQSETQVGILPGSGSDVWGLSDEFDFYHLSTPEPTQRQIIVNIQQVVDLSGEGLSEYAKTGIMLREDLDQDSIAMFFGWVNGPNGPYLELAARPTKGGQMSGIQISNQTLPKWFRVDRDGATVRAYYGLDGNTWTFAGEVDFVDIDLLAGIAVLSHNNSKSIEAYVDDWSIGALPDTLAPTVPAGLSVSNLTETTADLSWNASADQGGGTVAGYRVRVTPSGGSPVTIDAGNVTSYQLNGLTEGTTYTAEVQAYDNASPANSSPYSSSQSFNTVAVVVSEWQLTEIGTASGGSWDEAAGELITNGAFVQGAGAVGATDSVSFVHRTTPIAGDFELTVRFLSNTGLETQRRLGVMLRTDLDDDSIHRGLSIEQGNARARVFFRDAKGATGGLETDQDFTANIPEWVRVKRVGSDVTFFFADTEAELTQYPAATSYTYSGLVYVGLFAISANLSVYDTISWENLSFAETANGLSAPQNFRSTAQTDTTVTLAWDAVAGATGYQVRRDGGTPVDVNNVLTWQDTGLSASAVFSYEVRAYDGNGQGPWTSALSVTTASIPDTTAPGAIPAPTTGIVTYNSIQVNWTAASDNVAVTSYEVQTNNGAWVDVGNVLSKLMTGLSAETSYFFRVRAKDAAGNVAQASAPSASVTTAQAPGQGSLVYNQATGKFEYIHTSGHTIELHDFTDAGLTDGHEIPASWTADQTVVGNDKAAIESAINALPDNGGVVYVPNGTYNVNGNITINKTGVKIVGESRSGVIINCSGGSGGRGVFNFSGGKTGPRRFITNAHNRYDRTIDISGSSGFTPQVGDYIHIQLRGLPPEVQYRGSWNGTAGKHPEEYGAIFAGEWYFDMFQVKGVSGSQITLDKPLLEPFDPAWGQVFFLEELNTKVDVGVANMTINMASSNMDGITFGTCAQVFVDNVTINNPGSKPVYWDWAVGACHGHIRNCLFTKPQNTGGGGNGYGGVEHTYNILFDNCQFDDYRHAPNMQTFAAGNVFKDCTFNNSNAECHTKPDRHNMIDNCYVNTGDHSFVEYAFKTMSLHHASYGHNISGVQGMTLWNNQLIVANGTKGGGIKLGGHNRGFRCMFNQIEFGGTDFNDSAAYALSIQDFCDDMWVVGNKFMNRRVNPAYTYTENRNTDYAGVLRSGNFKFLGVAYLPGYLSGRGTETDRTKRGQTGIGPIAGEVVIRHGQNAGQTYDYFQNPLIPYTRQFAETFAYANGLYPLQIQPIDQGTGVTPADVAQTHFVDNDFRGTTEDDLFVGFNSPTTNVNNQAIPSPSGVNPPAEAPFASLYDAQKAYRIANPDLWA